jgi:hypothetical protein
VEQGQANEFATWDMGDEIFRLFWIIINLYKIIDYYLDGFKII